MTDANVILLVDDDDEFCSLLSDLFADSNYSLVYTTDPHDGLRQAMSRKDLALIFLDITMPELDGLTILEELKKTHARHVPVVLLTAIAESEFVHQALQLGAQDYLLKPLRIKQLQQRLEAILKQELFTPLQPAVVLTPAPLKGKTHTVLLVDDAANTHFYVQEILAHTCIKMLSVGSGREALELIEREAPDLVLLDVHMPEMNGIEVLRQIRQQDLQLKVVMLTSDNDAETVKQTQELGVQGYLLKPYKYHAFVSKLEEVLGIALFPDVK